MKIYPIFLILIIYNLNTLAQGIKSPNGNTELLFELDNNGTPIYSVLFKGSQIIKPSRMGIHMKDKEPLASDFEIVTIEKTKIMESWSPVLGEQSVIENHCNQASFSLKHKITSKKMNIVFRVFNEGVAFRYEFPFDKSVEYFIISDEKTEFRLTGDHKVFWIPGDYDSQEYVYNESKLSEIDIHKLNLDNGISLKSIKSNYRVQSPLMMKTMNGHYINIFEAAVDNYPVMHLDVDIKNFSLKSNLVPDAVGNKAYLRTPGKTPWRTIMISDDARDILSSNMILNLNEPCKIEDVSFIKPMKYLGIWWEMHVGMSSWDYAGTQSGENNPVFKPHGRHGATTENAKRYIDFASKYGFDGVLIEGWNSGWEDWYGNWKDDVFDFLTPYPDFDLEEVNRYAREKDVKMIMHHETSGSVGNYERHLDRAFDLMQKYDYPAVKTGYVGRIIPRGEFHDGQSMVNHYHYVARRAAEYKIMVNSHESSRPTGFHRTYPNYIAAEAARGNEFNAWSIGNPPMHETILPFTRLLGGPMDYTPGIFEIKMNVYNSTKKEQVHTTLAKQLALYLTMYSPLQMAADLPQNYEKYPDAFQFIKDVALDWQKSIYLEAEPGDYITVARKEKNGERWFLGAITDENSRKTNIKLDFLDKDKNYIVTIYQDGKNAHWQSDPINYEIRQIELIADSTISLNLAPGGGCAIIFIPK
ncbi:MAG: glycoside hydrolase family 97 protein [Deltaproteobacteria bacterium]